MANISPRPRTLSRRLRLYQPQTQDTKCACIPRAPRVRRPQTESGQPRCSLGQMENRPPVTYRRVPADSYVRNVPFSDTGPESNVRAFSAADKPLMETPSPSETRSR